MFKDNMDDPFLIFKFLNKKKNVSMDNSNDSEVQNEENYSSSKNKKGFFSFLKNYVSSTKKSFSTKIKNFFGVYTLDKNIFYKLEKILLTSDIGTKTTKKIISNFKKDVYDKEISDMSLAMNLFKSHLLVILQRIEKPLILGNFFPRIILIVGVNGVGKTTAIAKLAYKYKEEGKSVMLVAADTFRAAAIDQLEEWGYICKIPVFSKSVGSDPASVVFEAIRLAKSKDIQILIIDTAGRLHNKEHLMQELQKINRVVRKSGIIFHETILVIDASTGQNTIQQTRLFYKKIGITGMIMTKLDGTAKGGILFSIASQFKVPLYFIGTGEKITDLEVFDAYEFIESIF